MRYAPYSPHEEMEQMCVKWATLTGPNEWFEFLSEQFLWSQFLSFTVKASKRIQLCVMLIANGGFKRLLN